MCPTLAYRPPYSGLRASSYTHTHQKNPSSQRTKHPIPYNSNLQIPHHQHTKILTFPSHSIQRSLLLQRIPKHAYTCSKCRKKSQVTASDVIHFICMRCTTKNMSYPMSFQNRIVHSYLFPRSLLDSCFLYSASPVATRKQL